MKIMRKRSKLLDVSCTTAMGERF